MNLRKKVVCPSPRHRKRHLIEEARFMAAGREFCCYFYWLGVKGAGFEVEIGDGEDCRRADLGQDLLQAVTTFEALVNGRVTPCTLQDVVSDRFG